jgi:hypothetical protein
LTDLFDDSVGVTTTPNQQRTNSLPPNWSIQNNKDGAASYYFNTITGEMRSTYPYDNFDQQQNGSISSDEDESVSSTIDSNSRESVVLDGQTSTFSSSETSSDLQISNGNDGGKVRKK